MDKNPQPRIGLTLLGYFWEFLHEIRNPHATQDLKHTYVEILEEFNFKFEFCARKTNMKSLPKKVYKN